MSGCNEVQPQRSISSAQSPSRQPTKPNQADPATTETRCRISMLSFWLLMDRGWFAEVVALLMVDYVVVALQCYEAMMAR